MYILDSHTFICHTTCFKNLFVKIRFHESFATENVFKMSQLFSISGYISTPPWPGDEFTVFVHCPLSSENELEKVHCPNFCPLSTACPLSNFLSTVHCPLSNFLSTGHCPIYCPLSTVQRFWVGAGGGTYVPCSIWVIWPILRLKKYVDKSFLFFRA